MVSICVSVPPKARLCMLTTSLTNFLPLLFLSFMPPLCCLWLFLFPPWLLFTPDSPNKVRSSLQLYHSTHYWCTDDRTAHSRSPCRNRNQTKTLRWHVLQCVNILHWHLIRQLIRFSTSNTSVHVPHNTSVSTDDCFNQALMDRHSVENMDECEWSDVFHLTGLLHWITLIIAWTSFINYIVIEFWHEFLGIKW